MANAKVLSLAMKVTADGSSVPKQLTPVERALANLGKEADKATSVLDKLASGSAAAAAAQAKAAGDFDKLAQALAAGLNAEEYARQFAALEQSVKDTAAAFEEGLRITEQNRTAEERRAAELEKLARLLDLGAIDQETYNRAAAEASGANAEAARAERERADAAAAAARIIQANLTPLERYDQQVQDLAGHLQAGRFSQEQFDRAVASATASFVKAESAAKGYDRAVEAAGDGGSLKFNELSGILAALPGPIGNVAGRLSGLASAGEGLSRVFAGGLRQGIAGIGSAINALVNPFTAAAGAAAAFGTGAALIGRGLIALEDRVEALGNTADKLGVSFEFVQTLDEAARRSGTSIDAVSAAFGRLQKSVTGVDEESKAAQKALAEIGVTAQELQSLDPQEQYRLIAERIAGIEDPARRTATSLNLFGRAGADLLPFFNNIGGAAEDLARFGSTLSTAQRRDIDEFGSALDKLSVSAKGAGGQIVASFTPVGTVIANALASATGAITRFVEDQNKATQISQEFAKLRSEYTGVITDQMIEAINAGKTADEVLGRAAASTKALKDAIEEPADPQFLKSLEDINKQIEKAKEQSAEFGQAGFDAAVEYQDAIASLKQQLEAGLFNEETFRREADKAGVAFRQELDQLEENAQLDIQINADAEKTLAGLNAEVDKAIRGAQQFGQEGFDAAVGFQDKINELKQQFEAGIINETVLKDGVAAANAEYDQQISKIKEVQAEQQRLIENDRARVDELLKTDDATSKVQSDLDTLQREVQRTEEQLAAARADGQTEQANAAATRLAQLDQLQAQLDENLQAAEQGFGEAGFGPAFDAINAGLNDAAERAAEFGNAGANAFAELQAGVELAQQQARDGILNKEALDQQIAAQQKAFNQELKNIDEANQAREKAQADAAKQQEEQEKAIADTQRKQAEAVADARQKQQQAIQEQQRQAYEEQRKAEEAEFARQSERITALNTLGSRTVQTADVRTQEGAAIVLGLAADAQDPQLIQQRLTNKILNRIAAGIDRDLTRLGQPAIILP